MAIRAALIFNNHGKPRLTRFYSRVPISQQQALIQRIFALVHRRTVGNEGREVCNFLDAPELRPLLPPATRSLIEGGKIGGGSSGSSSGEGDQVRVIYRHYATLFFVFVVDESESELGILDLIQVFVESLDRCFENVCELDLIFHFDQVHAILNEIIQGGLVLETNINEIVTSVQNTAKARRNSAASMAVPRSNGSSVTNGSVSALESRNTWTSPAGLTTLPWSDAATNVGEWAKGWGSKLGR